MKIKIKEQKASEIFFENQFYKVGEEINVEFSTAIRMGKNIPIEMYPEDKIYDPKLFHNGKKFNFTSDIDLVSGWGNVSYSLLKGSKDYDISLTGRVFDVKDRDIYKMSHTPISEQGAMIWHEQPKDTWENSPFAKNIAIIPFETTVIPRSWIKKINNFDALFVPCQQNKDAFESSGVKVPIEIIHWGFDPNLFYELERPERKIFTFGTMGALSHRKGTDVLIDAFREAFPPHLKDVRLICKTSYSHYPYMVKDPRIIVQMTPVHHQELMDNFFKEIDCYVSPTRGEGWGMTITEAMATGVPAIVTDWSGPKEFMSEDDGYLLDYTMEKAKNFTKTIYKEECGEWANPSKEHLKELMLHCYNNREEVKEKGKKAAKRMKDEFTWDNKVKMFHAALDKYL